MGHASVRSQQSYGRKSKKSKGGFNDIADVETNVKPRGGDRLLRFKIANKNKAAAKIADTSTPSSPPPAPVRRFKMWTLHSSGGPLLDCEGLARPAGRFYSKILHSEAEARNRVTGWVSPVGDWSVTWKPMILKTISKVENFTPLVFLKFLDVLRS